MQQPCQSKSVTLISLQCVTCCAMLHKCCSSHVWIEITGFYCTLQSLSEHPTFSSGHLFILDNCLFFGNPSSSFLYTSVYQWLRFIWQIILYIVIYREWGHNIYPFCAFLPVEFDDCAGNENVQFEVSDPSFHVDGDLNLVAQRDGPYSSPVLFIHGLSTHADDMAQVEVTGLPVQSPHTLRVSRNCC